MTKRGTKSILWENVAALMQYHWHEVNLQRLARETKIGVGSAARIKEAENSTGVEILEKIAGHFKVEPWQLLLPEFDPARPTARPSDPDRLKWLRFYDRMNSRQRTRILGVAEEFLADDEGQLGAGGSG